MPMKFVKHEVVVNYPVGLPPILMIDDLPVITYNPTEPTVLMVTSHCFFPQCHTLVLYS